MKNFILFNRFKLLTRILNIIPSYRIKYLIGLLLILAISIFFDILSIGVVIPFVDSIINADTFLEKNKFFFINYFFKNVSIDDVRLILTLFFVGITIIAAIFHIILIWYSTYVINIVGSEVNAKVFTSIIYRDYTSHVNSNSSQFLGNITKSEDVISATGHIINFFISLIQIFFIVLFLAFLDNSFYIFFFGTVVIFLYVTLSALLKKKVSMNSKKQSILIDKRFKTMQESLYVIKEIIIGNLYNIFINEFKKNDLELKKIIIKSHLLTFIPGLFITTIAIISIGIIIYFMSLKNQSITLLLPSLTAMVYAAQKILGLIQLCYVSYTKTKLAAYNIYDVINTIEKYEVQQKFLKSFTKNYENKIEFKNQLTILNGEFTHKNKSIKVFGNLNINIKKNSFNLLIGPTGSGKSTLVDILMGLLFLDKGTYKVDQKILNEKNIMEFQKMLAHVPQKTGFIDDSIKKNIIYGHEYNNNFDLKKMVKCCEISCALEFINKLDKKYDTIIGENGSLLSGGQKQRIAISRALYSGKEIIIMDEATNALDLKTENKLFYNLFNNRFEKTFIIISHRENLIKDFNFDNVFKLQDNSLQLVN